MCRCARVVKFVFYWSQNYGVATRTRAARTGGGRPRHEMKALEDGPPAVAAGFGVRQTGACRTRHGLRGRRYAVSSLELVGRGGLGRRLLDGLGELEVVVVDPLLRLVLFLTELLVGSLGLADARSR